MSFDLSFLPRPTDGDWDAAVEAQEERAEGEPRAPTDADRARFDAVEQAVRTVLPDATVSEGAHGRELDHEPTTIQVSAYAGDPGEIAVSVPYWYDEGGAAPVVAVLRQLAAAIEAATVLVAYDPQAGGPFLGHGDQHAGAAFGTVDRLARRPGLAPAVITDVGGIEVGHWTDAEARTGCTVVLVPEGTTASAEVRGGAPASRELDLLVPDRLVDRIDAVVLTGGSAFGLAAADGVMGWLEERGRGFATSAGPVPIVPTLALFDLGVGSSTVRPGPAEGRAACDAATAGPVAHGRVGAGTGATHSKWLGPVHALPGGLGGATVRVDGLVVAALVAVNAYGSIDTDGRLLEGIEHALPAAPPAPMGNTTIGVIATNARLDKGGCLVVAQGGHDGMGRSIVPAHTRVDGDALVALATGEVDAVLDHVRLLAVAAVERAIRSVA